MIAYNLLEFFIDFNDFVDERNKLIRKKFVLTSDATIVDVEWIKLNAKQRIVADVIYFVVDDVYNEFIEKFANVSYLFFLDDSSDTEKIFVQNIVMSKLRFEEHIVFVVVSSDIVATLLNENQTAHARFKISLNSIAESTCNIKKKIDRNNLLKQIKLIFWDEFLMQRKFDMLTINRTLFDICDVDERVFFKSKMIYFCDDFRQILSVCSSRNKNHIVDTSLQKISFWKKMNILHLIENMRLKNSNLFEQRRFETVEFVEKILNIDNVIITVIFNDDDKNWISWRHDFLSDIDNSSIELIKKIYSQLKIAFSDADYLRQRVILVIVNIDVKRINNVCVDVLFEQIHFKFSNDKIADSKLKKKFSSECFHNYNEISISSHILRLKVDMFIMLFRNIRFFVICNDTRARFTRVTFHVLKIEMMSNKSIDEKILIFRISLDSKNDEINKNRRKIVLCQFTRRQYFIRAIFVMTINKSQN